ncbi:uncharacterized protein METZ01_LOCUS477751 [marine metagenome]|uniref:Uncharacterized protein n=1 Tax=marine metagenome TaxID=408172 RepID=A0A383BXK0_9ZZZZ
MEQYQCQKSKDESALKFIALKESLHTRRFVLHENLAFKKLCAIFCY